MERLALPGLGRDRLNRRRLMTDCILELQEDGASCEYLRQACQEITRPSRLFAQHFGRAQAGAVRELLEDPDEMHEGAQS